MKEIGSLKADQGSECKQNVRLTEDCLGLRGFKLKAINHKSTNCQTLRPIQHFGEGFQEENFKFRVFLLKLLGATKLSESSFFTPPCCSTAPGSRLVTNRKT